VTALPQAAMATGLAFTSVMLRLAKLLSLESVDSNCASVDLMTRSLRAVQTRQRQKVPTSKTWHSASMLG
jgi:hypothetical protein